MFKLNSTTHNKINSIRFLINTYLFKKNGKKTLIKKIYDIQYMQNVK